MIASQYLRRSFTTADVYNKFYTKLKQDLTSIFDNIHNGNFDLALKQADTLESYIINHNKAFKDESNSLAKVTFARATALVNRGKMNAITGNKAQAMQDLELAKGLTDKVIDELEEQYGEVGDYTMAANKLMLNIQ